MKTLQKRICLKQAEKWKPTPEQKREKNIKHIINKIRTGDLDLDKVYHQIYIRQALKYGRIEKTEDGYKEVDL